MTPALLAALAAPVAAQEAPIHAPRRFALAVGANHGGTARTDLRYAHDDARTMRDVMVAMGGVAPGDGRLLLDPTASDLRIALDEVTELVAHSGGRTELVFYYSGHSDEEGLLLGEERLPYSELRAWMDGLGAKVRLAVLDSCASGALIRSKGGQRVAPFLVDEGTAVDGLAYITSSSRDEVSQEADALGGSYFTHYLTTGLRGAADRSGDSRVSLTEAYSFAREETLRRTERTRLGPQHANHEFDLSGSGDLVLTDLATTDATLVLGAELQGLAVVRTPQGALYAELTKTADRSVELALPTGDYEVTLSAGDGRYAVADVHLERGMSLPVELDAFLWYDGEETVARGDRGAPIAILEGSRSTYQEPLRLELLPGFPAGPADATDRALLGLGGARAQRLDGAAAAFGVVQVVEEQRGFTFAFGGVTAGELRGVQSALGLSHTAGDVSGAQLAIGANVARGERFVGTQLSAGLNVLSSPDARAAQLTTGVNVARGQLDGTQMAPLNVAQGFEGLQLGIINVGQDVSGLQMGLINVARDVKGSQVGLINVSRDVKGAPLGLLSFEKQGRHDLLLFASESDWLNGEVRLGGDYLYTTLAVGGIPQNQLYVAGGLGGHAPFAERFWVDLDLSYAAYVVASGGLTPFQAPPTPVARARATFGGQVAKEFAPFAGLSFNVRTPMPEGYLPQAVGPSWVDPAGGVVAWPGFFAGIQI